MTGMSHIPAHCMARSKEKVGSWLGSRESSSCEPVEGWMVAGWNP